MDNHETQAKLGTQDTEQQRQSWDTDNIGNTRHRTKSWDTDNIGHTRHRTTKTIMRHRQYWAHKTQNNKDNQSKTYNR